ncbi:hypothetical protein DFH06DRAFT_1318298 [Mycena polygramma]|nr:hypothetical protein DFH06DRAFT_1318298 [Mycena polygramma]
MPHIFLAPYHHHLAHFSLHILAVFVWSPCLRWRDGNDWIVSSVLAQRRLGSSIPGGSAPVFGARIGFTLALAFMAYPGLGSCSPSIRADC